MFRSSASMSPTITGRDSHDALNQAGVNHGCQPADEGDTHGAARVAPAADTMLDLRRPNGVRIERRVLVGRQRSACRSACPRVCHSHISPSTGKMIGT